MRPVLKCRSTSLPQLRKRIYSKITANFQQEQWRVFLEDQQEMNVVIKELSKAEFDIHNQNKFKYTARSILITKKDIISHFQNHQIKLALAKLVELQTKVSINEKRKTRLIITFVQCRQQLREGVIGREESLIIWLKEKLSDHLNGNEAHPIKIKLLTILSILLLRFHGILMGAQEKLVLFKTVQLKKKMMQQLNQASQKQGEFECLLYLLLELYKILYLLKKDQQTIHFYYNQLHAYTQIYLLRQQNRRYLDIAQINRILENMKPILSGLDIYQDSKLRKEFAFAHIQEEIILDSESIKNIKHQERQRQLRRKSIQIMQANPRRKEKQLTKLFNNCSKPLLLNRNSQDNIKNSSLSANQPQQQNINIIYEEQIKFSFLSLCRQRLYVVSVSILFTDNFGKLEMTVTVANYLRLVQIFKVRDVEIGLNNISCKSIARVIEKISFFIFKPEGYFNDLNNLSFSMTYLPTNIDKDHLLVAIARVKSLIDQHLKHNYLTQSIFPDKFGFFSESLEELKASIANSQLNESKKESNMFVKREGLIIREFHRNLYKKIKICIKILIKKVMENKHQHYLLNIYFEKVFKGLEIYLINENETEGPEMTEFIKTFKQIGSFFNTQNKYMNRQKILQQILGLQPSLERVVLGTKLFKLEQELQINQQKIIGSVIQVKSYQFRSQSKKFKTNILKEYEMIKMKKQYYLFVKQMRNEYLIYKNQKAKIFLPITWRELGWKLVKDRLRLYSGIKIEKPDENHFIKTCTNDEVLQVKEQKIVLKLLRHFIIRKLKGYSIVIQYKTPEQQFLYQVILDKQNRYFWLNRRQVTDTAVFGQSQIYAENSAFVQYRLGWQRISEANHYYLYQKNH